MNYNNWVSAKDIPTIRRLDYIVEGTDGMESGYLYERFRHLSGLSKYNSPELTDERKNAEFDFSKNRIQENVIWINDWMLTHNREIIFTDMDDWRAIGRDYDYFWELRTKDQFVEEEARARLGLSNRTPINWVSISQSSPRECDEKLMKLIDEYIETYKKEHTFPV